MSSYINNEVLTHYSGFCSPFIPYILAQGNPSRKSMLYIVRSLRLKSFFFKKKDKTMNIKTQMYAVDCRG